MHLQGRYLIPRSKHLRSKSRSQTKQGTAFRARAGCLAAIDKAFRHVGHTGCRDASAISSTNLQWKRIKMATCDRSFRSSIRFPAERGWFCRSSSVCVAHHFSGTMSGDTRIASSWNAAFAPEDGCPPVPRTSSRTVDI